MKLLLTGKMGVGKTTVLNRAIKKYNIRTGIFTQKKGENVYAWFLYSNKKFIIGKKSSFGMEIQEDGFKNITTELKNIRFPDFFVIDEIGFLEEKYPPFLEEIKRIIEESKNFIGIVRLFFHNRYDFLNTLPIIEITEENRNDIEI
ncbi:nucleoside-triphosphatase [Marinitoga hydrogenitolerans DSM 16785]|uniref:Nucleoside-triphosphatase n=1 Tax=Marinitoga hydrogenitolerans (strain DSM 16785 / JCM 12826 / AT1271) TaxID=1122195 RepID=A0A1M4T3U8_MARH1|nr:nucleoside-triphosphatase [Marinitoga hydrogenitolerans]SHE39105.1 nucleoside-triphosphatase [Marinitoga hydrogenitolerans DSM 16785]